MPPNKNTSKEQMECIYSHKHNCNCYKTNMSQLQDIQKTAREILELLCGLGQGEIDCNTEGQMKLEEILDSLIDKTVQSEQERILMEIEDLFKPNEWTVWNTGSKMIEKDKLISLITNKSDINNNKE